MVKVLGFRVWDLGFRPKRNVLGKLKSPGHVTLIRGLILRCLQVRPERLPLPLFLLSLSFPLSLSAPRPFPPALRLQGVKVSLFMDRAETSPLVRRVGERAGY